MVDLRSSGPLPPLPALPTFPPTRADADDKGLENRQDFSLPDTDQSSGMFWLDGDVLMCACPDCSAPMTIRLWLMIADCWRCETSIELTLEQEREVRRLLERHAKQTSAVPQDRSPRPRLETRPLATHSGATTAVTPAVGSAVATTRSARRQPRVTHEPSAPPARRLPWLSLYGAGGGWAVASRIGSTAC